MIFSKTSLPRIVRVGDTADAAFVVTVDTAVAGTIPARVLPDVSSTRLIKSSPLSLTFKKPEEKGSPRKKSR